MKEQSENPKTPQTDKPAISISGMLADGGSNQAVNSNRSTEGKIQKSEALAEFVLRRLTEVRTEWEKVKEKPHSDSVSINAINHNKERKLYGQFLAFKEVADMMWQIVRASDNRKDLSRIERILINFPIIQNLQHGK